MSTPATRVLSPLSKRLQDFRSDCGGVSSKRLVNKARKIAMQYDSQPLLIEDSEEEEEEDVDRITRRKERGARRARFSDEEDVVDTPHHKESADGRVSRKSRFNVGEGSEDESQLAMRRKASLEGRVVRKARFSDEEEEPAQQSKFATFVDLSSDSFASSKRRHGARVLLGGNYAIETGNVTFTAGNTQGVFEAVTLLRLGGSSGKKDSPLNMPIRLLPKLLQGVERLRHHRDINRGLAPKRKIPQSGDVVDGREVIDLSAISSTDIPKMTFKLDELFWLTGETVEWPKGNQYDAVSLIRKPKEADDDEAGKKKRSPFTLSLPAKYLDALCAALTLLKERAERR